MTTKKIAKPKKKLLEDVQRERELIDDVFTPSSSASAKRERSSACGFLEQRFERATSERLDDVDDDEANRQAFGLDTIEVEARVRSRLQERPHYQD